jgi:hypothetical protein
MHGTGSASKKKMLLLPWILADLRLSSPEALLPPYSLFNLGESGGM